MADIQFRLSAGMSLEMPSGHIMTQVIFGAGTSKGEFPCRTIEVTDKPWRGELEETIKQYGMAAMAQLRKHCADEAKSRQDMRQRNPSLAPPDVFRGIQVMVTVPKGYRKPPGYNRWEIEMKARDGFFVADPERAKAPELVPA